MVIEKKTPAISVERLVIEYEIEVKKGRLPIGRRFSLRALDGVSFSVMPGESVAVLGKNGAGKSTLLRSIGGHLRPKSGEIVTRGRVYTLAGANPGMIPYMSGRENVSLLAGAYGIPKNDRSAFVKEVEDFCELGEAFDRKFRTLSSGMAGRIGFGFTTSLDPEVLLMDETLGVGDEEFRKKAEAKAEAEAKEKAAAALAKAKAEAEAEAEAEKEQSAPEAEPEQSAPEPEPQEVAPEPEQELEAEPEPEPEPEPEKPKKKRGRKPKKVDLVK